MLSFRPVFLLDSMMYHGQQDGTFGVLVLVLVQPDAYDSIASHVVPYSMYQ